MRIQCILYYTHDRWVTCKIKPRKIKPTKMKWIVSHAHELIWTWEQIQCQMKVRNSFRAKLNLFAIVIALREAYNLVYTSVSISLKNLMHLLVKFHFYNIESFIKFIIFIVFSFTRFFPQNPFMLSWLGSGIEQPYFSRIIRIGWRHPGRKNVPY